MIGTVTETVQSDADNNKLLPYVYTNC